MCRLQLNPEAKRSLSVCMSKKQHTVSVSLGEPTKEPMRRSLMWDSGFTCHSFPGTCSFPLQVLEEMRLLLSPSSMLSLVGGPFSGKASDIKVYGRSQWIVCNPVSDLQSPL